MDFVDYLASLKASADYHGQVAHVEYIPRRAASYAEPAEPLHPQLASRLHALGVDRLYRHQAAAISAVRRGEHVVVVTATASGKSLCYNVPAVEAALEDRRARALYLFPTKALAQDQLGKLGALGLADRVRCALYDGDTPPGERPRARQQAQLLLTNPDMLHVGILPYHSGWADFLANLRYVVLDEVHTYRGVFGANVAHVLRRLRRLCANHGSSPRFIACSATIANPGSLVRALTGLDATVVEDDGAPAGRRVFVFWNPPLLGSSGERRSAHVEAAGLLTGLVRAGARTLVFAKARKSAELILRYARQQLSHHEPALCARVRSYRAGYRAEERRAIEEGLFRGHLLGVACTNALELGVDVGHLDATVLAGYPGTVASARQQAGRSGRGSRDALSILIGLSNPLDQYLMGHPDYFFGRAAEEAIADPDNPRIVAAHLACAAYEMPIGSHDVALFGPGAPAALSELEADGVLQRRGGRWYYRLADYPAADVNIRSASGRPFEVRMSGSGQPIGTVEASSAYATVHPGAVYLHQGDTYVVDRLDERARAALVHPAEVNYYTEPREVTHIEVAGERSQRPLGPTAIRFGDVVVSTQVLGYRRKRLYSDDVLAVVDLDLPEQVFETEAAWFEVPPDVARRLVAAAADLPGSIHAAEHALIAMLPLFAMCDRWDVGGVSSPCHPHTRQATIFIYDAYPGGVGIAEAVCRRGSELIRAAADLVGSCPCDDGCPSCVQSPKCGNNNEPLDKRGAAHLLRDLAAEEACSEPEAHQEHCAP